MHKQVAGIVQARSLVTAIAIPYLDTKQRGRDLLWVGWPVVRLVGRGGGSLYLLVLPPTLSSSEADAGSRVVPGVGIQWEARGRVLTPPLAVLT